MYEWRYKCDIKENPLKNASGNYDYNHHYRNSYGNVFTMFLKVEHGFQSGISYKHLLNKDYIHFYKERSYKNYGIWDYRAIMIPKTKQRRNFRRIRVYE